MGLWDVGEGTGKYVPSKIKEATIVDNMIKAIRKKYEDVVVLKIHGGMYQRSGIPDIYIQLKSRPIWVEVKRPGGDTTALQHYKLKQLKKAGAYVGTATSTEEMLDLIEDVLKGGVEGEYK